MDTTDCLAGWECQISRFGKLANLAVRVESDQRLVVTLENVDSNNKYVVSFSDVLGYRFERAFGSHRLANTFRVMNSSWIASMQRKPFGCIPIDTALHYLISSHDGELEVVSLVAPTIEVEQLR